MLSVIDPLLADHVLREAERFLEILRALERGEEQVPAGERF
ncbi:DUF2935 domain-containing protein [Limnochorda pilosa]|nr:DUF2935 domain-containing protein [Limnochorda pilosa]